jgi:glycine cleavage system H lipoate-binding protein
MKTQVKNDSPACLWMQAGVVKEKKCFKEFACAECRFERAMTNVCRSNHALKEQGITLEGKKAGFVFWKEKLGKNPLAKRPCIHHMKGHISFKACPKTYQCIDCEFDQFFNDQFKVYTLLKPVQFDEIHGIFLPMGYYLSPGHTWIKIEDNGMVCMGIDDFASRLLGQFDTLSTPLMGKKLVQGKPAVTLTRQGNEICFVSPVNGVITQVNTHVQKSPDLILGAPYTEGWILSLYCPNLKQDLQDLLFMDKARKFMDDSISHLYEFLEEETLLAAADGGDLISDLYGNLPGSPDSSLWDYLVKEFIPQGP